MVLSDSDLFQGLFDLFLFEPHDGFIPDNHRRSSPSSGLLSQFFQVFRFGDHGFLDEGDAFLQEELPCRLAGVSGGIAVHNDLLVHR